MYIYRPEGGTAYRDFAVALAEEQEVAYELSQCVKVEVYSLMAQELFDRMAAAHAKTTTAFEAMQCFKFEEA